MPLDPRWVAAPPELVALIFEGGPGPESIVAYAAVMATEAASHQMGMAVSATNIATTSASWTGLAGTANVARGTALNMSGLEPLAATLRQTRDARASRSGRLHDGRTFGDSVGGVPGESGSVGHLVRHQLLRPELPGHHVAGHSVFRRLLAAEFQRRPVVCHHLGLDRGCGCCSAAGRRRRRGAGGPGFGRQPRGTGREHRGPGRRPGIDHRRRTARECWIGAF